VEEWNLTSINFTFYYKVIINVFPSASEL
jgi:hypothetical protein